MNKDFWTCLIESLAVPLGDPQTVEVELPKIEKQATWWHDSLDMEPIGLNYLGAVDWAKRLKPKEKEMTYQEKEDAWIKENDLKVGDEVLVEKAVENNFEGWSNSWAHEMDMFVGNIFKIKEINKENGSGIRLSTSTYGFPFQSLKKVEKQMKKSDLKSGMIIEDRDGDKYLILDILGELIAFDEDMDSQDILDKIDDDLKGSLLYGDEDYTILKVYELKKDHRNELDDLGDFHHCDYEFQRLIWTRKEKTQFEITLEELQATIDEAQAQIKKITNR